MDLSVIAEFRERLKKAHGKARPLVLDWETACKVRDALNALDKIHRCLQAMEKAIDEINADSATGDGHGQ